MNIPTSPLGERVKASIERLKAFAPKDGKGYYLAFSGGKDSVVCKALLDMAGIPYHAVYRVTSVDPPELVRFIRENHPDVKMEIPHDINGKPVTMWNLIPRKLMPPTRIVRYCCAALKESGGDGELAVTGVRWAESYNRAKNQGIVTIASKKAAKELEENSFFTVTRAGGVVLTNDNEQSRRVVESCYKRHKTVLNPIVEWSDADVWEFIKSENIPYCGLYDEGWARLGCIGCPMANRRGREREFARWPMYQQAYLRAFGRMIKERETRGKLDTSWKMGTTPMDVYNWWMEYDILPGQITLDDFLEELEDEV